MKKLTSLILLIFLLMIVVPQAFGSIIDADFEENNIGAIPFILTPGPGGCSVSGSGQTTVESMLGENLSKLLVLHGGMGYDDFVDVYLSPEQPVSGNLLIEWDAVVTEASGGYDGVVYNIYALGDSSCSPPPSSVAWDISLINDSYTKWGTLGFESEPMVLNVVQHFTVYMNTYLKKYSLDIDGHTIINDKFFNNQNTTNFSGIGFENCCDASAVVVGIDNLTVNIVPACEGDFDSDCDVDGSNLATFINNETNDFDVSTVAQNYGRIDYLLPSVTLPPVTAGPCKQCPSWQYGLQLDFDTSCYTMQLVVPCPCPTFDYESGDCFSPSVWQVGYGGYLSGQNVNGVLLKVSDCENVGEFNVNNSYAIRATIIEPASGVYFTNKNFTNPNNPHVCTLDGLAVLVADGEQKIYVSSHPDPLEVDSDYCVTSCTDPATDYALDYFSVTPGQELYDPADYVDYDCCFACGTTAVKSVETCCAQFLRANMPLLLIDLPMFVYDINDLNVCIGRPVVVRVGIIDTDGIALCSCDILVGTFQ